MSSVFQEFRGSRKMNKRQNQKDKSPILLMGEICQYTLYVRYIIIFYSENNISLFILIRTCIMGQAALQKQSNLIYIFRPNFKAFSSVKAQSVHNLRNRVISDTRLHPNECTYAKFLSDRSKDLITLYFINENEFRSNQRF